MTINISARPYLLTINSIDRKANFVSMSLSQNELADGGVFVSGEIELQANYDEIREFTYLASPSIGENWARGATVVYQVANQSGVLTNFPLSGGALYILKEPAPPDANLRIRLQIGDEAILKNYRSADVDVSGIVAGVSTARNTVIERYLAAAQVNYSISSIPYPFAFPQPKTEGNSLVDVAAQMARSANHILYTRPDGVLTNKAINPNAAPIATYRISEDEQLFEQVDSSGVETPVDQLVIAGISTLVDTEAYPRVKQQVTRATYRFYSRDLDGGFTPKTYSYIQSRTTITDYGWDGAEERVTTFLEGSIIVGAIINPTITPEDAYINPLEETEQIKRYDARDRLIYERTNVSQYINLSAASSIVNLSGFGARTTVFPRQTKLPKSYEEIFYTYDDSDVLTSKRTESNNFAPNDFGFTTLSTQNDGYFQRTAKIETWSDGLYTIENQYKPRTFTFDTGGSFDSSLADQFLEGDWETLDSDSTYSTDGSTKPPSTTYRKPYEPIETQVTATLTAQPFAGQSFYSRSRPVDVPYLESQLQATDYGNIYLALLYGRKQGFIFGTALDDILLTSLSPLSRINVIWRSVRYECLTDGVSWSHTLTEMVIGMRLIVIGTALESDPPTTVYPVAIASALIQATATQASIASCVVSAEQFFGGTATQDSVAQCFVSEGMIIQGTATQEGVGACVISAVITGTATQDSVATMSITSSIGTLTATQDSHAEATISLDVGLNWAELTQDEWRGIDQDTWRDIG